jgi:serine/threonine-protein kinase
LLVDGTVSCWGTHFRGNLGIGGEPQDVFAEDYFFPTPQPVPGLAGVQALVSHETNTCALTEDKRLWCWGFNGSDEIDASGPVVLTSPTLVADVFNVVDMAVGSGYVCALLEYATVWCQGSSSYIGRGLGNGGEPGLVPLDEAKDYSVPP